MHELRSSETIDAVRIDRTPLWTDRRGETGAFDIIGDVHGCADELELLLARLGYAVEWAGEGENRRCVVEPPAGRRAIFVGDLVDRGPRTPDVLRVVHAMVTSGAAFCVPGNHDVKFVRWLNGRKVQLTHGLDASAAQIHKSHEKTAITNCFATSIVPHI